MDIEKQECYSQMTGQSYIETDYSINDLKLLIQLLFDYEPGVNRRFTRVGKSAYLNNQLGQYFTPRHIIERYFDIVIGNPPYPNNELGQYFTPRHIMSN